MDSGKKMVVATPTLCGGCRMINPAPKRRLSYRREADATQARLAAKRAGSSQES